MMNVMQLLLSFFLVLLTFKSWVLSRRLALFIPPLIREVGYPCFFRYCSSSWNLISSVFGSEIIVLRRRANEKGILILICLGWQEENSRYVLLSVGL